MCVFDSLAYTLGVELPGHVNLTLTTWKVTGVCRMGQSKLTQVQSLEVNWGHQDTPPASDCLVLQQPHKWLSHFTCVVKQRQGTRCSADANACGLTGWHGEKRQVCLGHFLFLSSMSHGRWALLETTVHQLTSDGLKPHSLKSRYSCHSCAFKIQSGGRSNAGLSS